MSRVTFYLLLILSFVILLFTVGGSHGLLQLHELNQEYARLAAKNRELESEIVQLQNKIYALAHSDIALEAAARAELGLSKPGEIVYIFSDPGKTGASPAREQRAQPSNSTQQSPVQIHDHTKRAAAR